MADLVGWVGTALMGSGSIYIAHKNILGLWLMLIGNVAFLASGYLSGLSSLMAVSTMMICLDYYGITRWRNS